MPGAWPLCATALSVRRMRVVASHGGVWWRPTEGVEESQQMVGWYGGVQLGTVALGEEGAVGLGRGVEDGGGSPA